MGDLGGVHKEGPPAKAPCAGHFERTGVPWEVRKVPDD